MRRNWARWLHRAVDAIDRSLGPRLRRSPAIERAWVGVLDAVVGLQADRAYFRRAIVPALARLAPRRVLFVGVRGYTRRYAGLFRAMGAEYWTADIDPAAAVHGEPGRHAICNVVELDNVFATGSFDVAVLNGFSAGAATRNPTWTAPYEGLRPCCKGPATF